VRKRLSLGLIPMILAGTAALAMPASAAAADGYTDVGTTTYTVNVAKSEIDVTVVLTIKNNTPSKTIPNTCFDGWSMWYCPETENFYYYDTFMWVPTQAGTVKATANSGSVKQSVYKTDAYGRELKLTFAKLYYGKTRTVTATYAIPAGPRAKGGYRALKAYAELCADSSGFDSGAINVVVPDGLVVSVTDGTALNLVRDKDGLQTYGSGSIAQNGFYSCVEATNPAALTSTPVTAGDQQFNVQGWPEDTTWATAVQTDLATDVPALEALTGLQMPGGTVGITEAATSQLGEYAGVYDGDTKTATLTEDTDNSTVAHELSHIWFNKTLFTSAWMYEGLAGYSEKAAGAGNYKPCTDPGTYPGTGSANLAFWTYLDVNSTKADEAVATWDYAASCYLVTKLADAIGPDNFKAVVVAASTGKPAYAGGDPSAKAAGTKSPLTAQELLDLIDELGMVPAGVTDPEQAQNLFVGYGILNTSELAGRTEARAAYHTLLTAAGKWGLPLAVQSDLADWKFSDAQTAMTTATKILALRDQIAKTLPSFNQAGSALEKKFESAATSADLDSVLKVAQAEADAAKVVAQAKQLKEGSLNPLQAIGLIGTDLSAPMTKANTELTSAKTADATADAHKVIDSVNGATVQGMLRIALVLVLLLLLLGLVLFVRWRMRRRGAPVLASADGTTPLPGWLQDGSVPSTSVAAPDVAESVAAPAVTDAVVAPTPPPAEPPL
jgi:hypothetical protein